MARVPLYRGRQTDLLRSGRQKAIIIGGVPIPACEGAVLRPLAEFDGVLQRQVRDKINGQTELVCGLPHPRFTDPLFNEVKLPVSQAECLKDLEMGLREAGFIGPGQVLRQVSHHVGHFRCEELDTVNTHIGGSFGEPGGRPFDVRSPASLKVPSQTSERGPAVKAKERKRALTAGNEAVHAVHAKTKALLPKGAKRRGRSPY